MSKLAGIEENQLSHMVKMSVVLDTGNVGQTIDINMATISALAYLNQNETIAVDSPVFELVQHSLGYKELFAEVVVKGKPAVSMSRNGHALLISLFGSNKLPAIRGVLDPNVPSTTRAR